MEQKTGPSPTATSGEQHILLPIPPSTNALFRNVPGKGRARSKVYKAWLAEAGWELLRQKVRPVLGSVTVEVSAVRQNKARDIDNILKPILDLLVKHGIIADDKHVLRVTAEWVDTGPAIARVVLSVVGK